jgi:glycerol-3-phosphate O-acyltransferase
VADKTANPLYIIDARNRVERRVLLDWVHATAGDREPQWVSLTIADGDHVLDLGGLKARLASEGGEGRGRCARG